MKHHTITFLIVTLGFAMALARHGIAAEPAKSTGMNLAVVAKASTSYVSPHETIDALNDNSAPRHSNDKSKGAYGNWPRKGTQWVQYEWTQPISTASVDVYWFDDRGGVRLPKAARLQYWTGDKFVPVENASEIGLSGDRFNTVTFREVTTTKLRLEMDSSGESTGLLEWRVYDSGKSPNFAPVVTAGVDRVAILGGKTYLNGKSLDDGKPKAALDVTWSMESGPGDVTFADKASASTTAMFSAPGKYVLKLTGNDGALLASSTLSVQVDPAPPAEHLMPVHMQPFKVNSPLWNHRFKALITNWIPHCYNTISDPAVKEGGIENFTEAGKKNTGQPFKRHVGPVFSNAWVYNTFESMCLALMVDPQGDAEIIAAQKAIRAKIDDWLPKLLSAQEPDGYIQTCYTLNNLKRWSNKHDHEDYLGGYFIEASLAHFQMTGRTDRRMYDAAKRLADCWYSKVGPASGRSWYGGHQELEQALVRLARVVDEVEGSGKGRKYVELAKFTMDCRRNGEEYDQSHLPVVQQYEAVGHSVRAVYSYSGMADIAMETGDIDYHSAVKSLWSNIVHKKYYVTGGVGSGETSEGFGKDYSLPAHAYCESCAGCGELFFQYKMNLIYRDGRYADLHEETLYNNILGSVDLEGKNFTYTNSLDSAGARYPWHGCPCCVGNISRTMLMLPTWMYARSSDGVYVNLFAGGTVNVGEVAGTKLQMVQATEYPWNGRVSITVDPAERKVFAVRIRVPDRGVSELYTNTPQANGIKSISVNGAAIRPAIEDGYAVIMRMWTAGDKIELELPMAVQRVKPSEKIAATRDRTALRFGPLIYNIEQADQNVDQVLGADARFTTEWKSDLLGGVVVIKGTFGSGSPLTAIPNYARNNRGGRSIVWIREK